MVKTTAEGIWNPYKGNGENNFLLYVTSSGSTRVLNIQVPTLASAGQRLNQEIGTVTSPAFSLVERGSSGYEMLYITQ